MSDDLPERVTIPLEGIPYIAGKPEQGMRHPRTDGDECAYLAYRYCNKCGWLSPGGNRPRLPVDRDPLLRMTAMAEVMVPESEVAERITAAVAAEREHIRLRILGCIRCHQVHLRRLTYDHGWEPRYLHGTSDINGKIADLIGETK